MYDFETLVAEVLRNKPDLSRADLTELIREKKKNVGAGYLTDQGALFLIAGELGVQLRNVTSSDLSLKDLYIGASDITVVARVLAIYPIAEFKRKDGKAGRYRRVNLFDGSGMTRLTIWDDNQEAMELAGITVDTPVRVVSGYVKQGLDGKPNLSVGKRGRIEMLVDQSLVSRLVSLEDLVKNLDDIAEGQSLMVAEGVSSSNGRNSSFTREDGSQGSMTQFELAGKNKRMRVVIWNGTRLPEVAVGQKLRITNLRTKNSQGQLELHGDSGTVVLIAGPGTSPSNTLVKVSEVKLAPAQIDLEVMALSKGNVADVRLRDGDVVRKGELVVGDDTGEITVVAWRDLAERLTEINVGEKLRLSEVTHQTSRLGTEILQLNRASRIEKMEA